MKFLFVCFLLTAHTFTYCQDIQIDEIRLKYNQVNGDMIKAQTLYDQLDKKTNKSSVEDAYSGVLQSILAGSFYNPFNKYSWFVSGKKNIENSVKKSPKDPEIRFLRLSVQYKAPKFLGYYDNIKEDTIVVLKSAEYFKEIGIYTPVKDFLIKEMALSEINF